MWSRKVSKAEKEVFFELKLYILSRVGILAGHLYRCEGGGLRRFTIIGRYSAHHTDIFLFQLFFCGKQIFTRVFRTNIIARYCHTVIYNTNKNNKISKNTKEKKLSNVFGKYVSLKQFAAYWFWLFSLPK